MPGYTADEARKWKLQLADSAPATDAQAELLSEAGYVHDLKWDGVRCLVVSENGNVTLHSRNGEDMTARFPEVVASLRMLPGPSVVEQQFVLDGEIIVFDPQTGVPDFRWTAHRKRQADIAVWAASHPATFVAFDCLGWGLTDARGLKQSERLELLEALIPPGNPRVQRSIYDTDGAVMMELVRTRNLEGLIAKDLNATYRAGRSKRWIKMKPLKSCTALATGYTAGTGWREEYFGALTLETLNGEHLVEIGEVGTGFKVDDLNLIDPLVKAGVPLMVEIQYQELTHTGKLRFPSYKGLRTDVDLTALTPFADL